MHAPDLKRKDVIKINKAYLLLNLNPQNLTFTHDQSRFDRSTGCGLAGRGEIITESLGKLLCIFTVTKSFEASALHGLYSLKCVFLVQVNVCSF